MGIGDCCYCMYHKFIVIVLSLIVLCAVAALVYGNVVVKVKPPTLTIHSISIQTLKYDHSPSFDMTMLMNISLHNHNVGDLVFNNQKVGASISIYYGNSSTLVGDSKLLEFKTDHVASLKKQVVGSLQMKLSSDNLKNGTKSNDRENLKHDVEKGVLKLTSSATLEAQVHVLKKRLRHVVAKKNCAIDIDLKTRSVQKLQC